MDAQNEQFMAGTVTIHALDLRTVWRGPTHVAIETPENVMRLLCNHAKVRRYRCAHTDPGGSPTMNFDSKDLIKLAEAGQIIPGKRDPSTIWRWINVGRYGIRLESLEVGGVTYTTRTAIQEFCEAVTAAKRAQFVSSDA